jgi:chemotaxis protein MotB
MQNMGGLHPDQVTQVRGFADQRLRVPAQPEDASNRRVSIIVGYPQPLPDDSTDPVEETQAEGSSARTQEPAKLAKH